VDPQEPSAHIIALAAQVIQRGGLVAFPTETVYGLGANALSAEAAARIFSAKGRPANDPLIVHLASADDLPRVAAAVPPLARLLAEAFWPGPLTLILPRHDAVPRSVTAGQETVAVRVPSHPVALRLLEAADLPIAAPSANRFSRPSPTAAAHVLADLGGRVDVILDGGSTSIGVESTIVDLTASSPTVLRPGGIAVEALREIVPDVQVRRLALPEDGAAPAPGTLLRHYSPDATVTLFTGDDAAAVNAGIARHAAALLAQGRRCAVLLPDDNRAQLPDELAVVVLGSSDEEAAARLFASLRTLESQVDEILVRAPRQAGLGRALWDRLWRAAEGRVVQV
jgi:L-threonylcarbamoyladenylate synthase